MYQNKDQFVGEFLNESFEGIGEINDHLNSYSKYPWQREEVDSIYRKIHTLKGSSAYLGFQKLENFSTLGETILDLVKEDKIELDNSLVEVFVKYSAVCFKLLKSIEKTGKEIEDDMGLTGDMVTFLEKRTIDHSLPPSRTRPIEYIGKVTDRKKDTEKVSSSIPSPKPRPVIPFAPTIKVKASLLDSIMATVGELVLNRNYIVSYVEQIKNPRLALLANELSNIAGRLHSSILLARMRPLNFILNNINSMVQELAHLLGKKIDFQIRGSRTELDKDIIEMIDTSLSHLVRNAIVHGVEDEGIIKVTAYNEKEQVVIDVEDNGRGVNQDLVLAKAIEKGFVSEVSNKNYSDCEKLNLIFHPGLSTASKVTKISGRGMGLDIVRNNLEKVNGKIEVYSSPSRGTNFRLKIPLTSAIVSVLTFNSGGAIFCIYQQNIVIIEKLKKEMVKFIGQEKFYRLNNSLITLIDLNEVLSLNLLNCNGDSSVIVVEVKGEFFAIVVDKVIDTQEVVLRPIDMMFDQQDIYSGATVIDDGPLALVLNLPSFCKMACQREIGIVERSSSIITHLVKDEPENNDLLLFSKFKDSSIYGIPLSFVERVELFAKKDIEWSGDRTLVKYRDRALELICFDELDQIERDVLHVIVISFNGPRKGLIVDKVFDTGIVETEVELVEKKGILGTGHIDEKIISIIDVAEIFSNKKGHHNFSGKILIVDDTSFYRMVVESIFKNSGIETITAKNGRDALNKIKENPSIKLIITDIVMPEMDGFAVVQNVRAMPGEISKVPIIAFSKQVTAENIKKGKEVGINDYIDKICKDEILDKVNSYIGQRAS